MKDLTFKERRKAQIALTYLTEKNNKKKTKKARTVYNGKPTREWLTREESASPTASTEGLFLTAMIDAHEERDVMSNDIPNAFIQTVRPLRPNKERVMMKITGLLVDLVAYSDSEF